MKGKRLLCAALLLLMLLAAVLPVLADDIVYFTAVNNTLLELKRETMPVKHNSMLYVPSSIFNSNQLGTYAYYSRSTQIVLISNGEDTLYFDMSAGNSYDSGEKTYRYAAIYANDTAYVPASFAANYFGLRYAYIRKNGMHIVRLSSGDVLSDDDFVRGASSLMETRLEEFRKQEEAVTSTPAPTPAAGSAVGTQPTPTAQIPTTVDRSDVTVHIGVLGLCEDSERLLQDLQQRELPVCFFATAAEIYDHADLVRRIVGEGGSIGAWLTEDPASEWAAFCDALRDTAMCAGFLAAAEEAPIGQAEELGVSLWVGACVPDFLQCADALEAAQGECLLLLKEDFREVNVLKNVLTRQHYSVEAIRETVKGRETP